ncbi:hypothetical protein P691DRAFT_790008, partial [Macrolepiota fuliginosa MF-IS2]
DIAEFFDLDFGKFHRLLERLHSVLHVPLADEAITRYSFYHASFSDFLEDRVPRSPPTHKPNAQPFLIGWSACRWVPDESIPSLISRLEHIDFSRLTSSHLYGIGEFLPRLHSLGSSRNRPLIAVVGEAREPLHRISYYSDPPHDYITLLIPEGQKPEFPFTVNLRLGKVGWVYIALEVEDFRGSRPPPPEPPNPDN